MDLPGKEIDDEKATEAAIQDFLNAALDDGDKERRREIIKKIVTAVLKYHIIPSVLPTAELSRNNTWATELSPHDGSFDGEAFRIRIAPTPTKLIPLSLSVNLISTIVKPNTFTSNGTFPRFSTPR